MEQGDTPVQVYERIRFLLETHNINVSNYNLIDYGLQFTVSMPDWTGVIRVYQNKKGIVKIDYSQLGGGVTGSKIRGLIETKRKSLDLRGSTSMEPELGFPIIGTDESGKGDYFGPLVSAGVYVDEQAAKDLIASNIKDSKKLTDSKNLELAKNVIRICKGLVSVIEISPEKYNDLYEQFKKENKTLNTLLAWGHAKAIEEILSKVDCKVAISDQFADEKFILSKLQEKGKRLRLVQMHKAEQNIAVAAASILSRARFLQKLAKLREEYRIDLPKGASEVVLQKARELIKIYGKETLRKVAKLHFKISAKVIDK